MERKAGALLALPFLPVCVANLNHLSFICKCEHFVLSWYCIVSPRLHATASVVTVGPIILLNRLELCMTNNNTGIWEKKNKEVARLSPYFIITHLPPASDFCLLVAFLWLCVLLPVLFSVALTFLLAILLTFINFNQWFINLTNVLATSLQHTPNLIYFMLDVGWP